MLKVTLVKSIIAGEPRNVKTAHALGLRKIGQSNIFEDCESIRGMIHKIKHLLKVEEVEDQPRRRRRIIRGLGSAPAAPEQAETAPKKAKKAKKEETE